MINKIGIFMNKKRLKWNAKISEKDWKIFEEVKDKQKEKTIKSLENEKEDLEN